MILHSLRSEKPRARAWAIGQARNLFIEEELEPLTFNAWMEAIGPRAFLSGENNEVFDQILFARRLSARPDAMTVLQAMLASIVHNPCAQPGQCPPSPFLDVPAGGAS